MIVQTSAECRKAPPLCKAESAKFRRGSSFLTPYDIVTYKHEFHPDAPRFSRPPHSPRKAPIRASIPPAQRPLLASSHRGQSSPDAPPLGFLFPARRASHAASHPPVDPFLGASARPSLHSSGSEPDLLAWPSVGMALRSDSTTPHATPLLHHHIPVSSLHFVASSLYFSASLRCFISSFHCWCLWRDPKSTSVPLGVRVFLTNTDCIKDI